MSETTGRPARYQRSFNGLIAALVVTVVAVVGFVVVRGVFAPDVEAGPEPVEYLEIVEVAQEAGYQLVYPERLPGGWYANSVDFEPGDRPAWRVGFLTDEGRFVGVRQAGDDIEDLLTTYVDEETVDEGEVSLDGAVATTWRRWSDDGGDRAYSAEVETETGEDVVLVYGSADDEDLRLLIGLLTTDPL